MQTMDITPVDGATHYSTDEVATMLGVSYRRVHHLVDTERVPVDGVGSGNRLRWPVALVRQLIVAQALTDASPGATTWPQMVADVVAGPEVPADASFAVWANGAVTYCTTVIEVVGALANGGGVVALVDV